MDKTPHEALTAALVLARTCLKNIVERKTMHINYIENTLVHIEDTLRDYAVCEDKECPLIPSHTKNVCREALKRMGFKGDS